MIAAALLMAGVITEHGPSPLAAEGHASQWEAITLDGPGEGWIDTAWHDRAEVDGHPVELVLVRMNLTDHEGGPMVLDSIMAVDCAAQTIGFKESWLFLSRYGNNLRAPITTVTMDFASSPPAAGDLAIIAHACTGARAGK